MGARLKSGHYETFEDGEVRAQSIMELQWQKMLTTSIAISVCKY